MKQLCDQALLVRVEQSSAQSSNHPIKPPGAHLQVALLVRVEFLEERVDLGVAHPQGERLRTARAAGHARPPR
eukprot:3997983-Prymnesium_polylepis.1